MRDDLFTMLKAEIDGSMTNIEVRLERQIEDLIVSLLPHASNPAAQPSPAGPNNKKPKK